MEEGAGSILSQSLRDGSGKEGPIQVGHKHTTTLLGAIPLMSYQPHSESSKSFPLPSPLHSGADEAVRVQGIEECEAMLAAKSQEGNEMVAQLVKSLGSALVYADPGNFETNRKLWNNYAAEWDPEASWVQKMAAGSSSEMLQEVGDEWSTKEEVLCVIRDFILPYVGKDSEVGEIGCGGGRVTTQVFEHIRHLTCFDISRNMLQRTRQAVGSAAEEGKVQFVLLEEPRLPEGLDDSLDFVILFDVLVHIDLHITYAYMKEVARILKPGGKAFLSTANLLSPGGWDRFRVQKKYSVGGFYFTCPDMTRRLLADAGLVIVKEAPPDPSNIYYHRDYLVLVEKPAL